VSERYKTHELLRWWLLEREAVRSHVLCLLLRLPPGTEFQRVDFHDTHPSVDVPGLEADALFRVWSNPDDSTMVIVEIQLSLDGRKAVTWTAYLSTTSLRYRTPALLGIITLDTQVEGWSRRTAPRTSSANLRVEVVGPGKLGRRLVENTDGAHKLERYVLAWLAGRRIAEYERALMPMLKQALAMDNDSSRWYIITLYRIAEMHAPHLKERIMNELRYKHPFQPLFDNEWAAYDRGVAAGRVTAYREILVQRVGESAVVQLLADVADNDKERVLLEAIMRSDSSAR
jgi:hypothetical protein